MTEEEAREIVERYERLAQAIALSAGYMIEAGGFRLEFPIEVHSGIATIRENDRWADDWRLASASMVLN